MLGAATPQLAYTASKGAVLSAMTRELAVIYARENIRVNALCPGPLRTELLMKFLDTPEKRGRRWYVSHGPLRGSRGDRGGGPLPGFRRVPPSSPARPSWWMEGSPPPTVTPE